MRSLLLSFVLATTAAYGQRIATPSDDGNFGQCGGRANRVPRGRVQFSNFCDRLTAADKVGNWWCINQDGSLAPGSATLTFSGTAVGQDPNPPYTCNGNGKKFAAGSTSKYATGSVAQPATGVTTCMMSSSDGYASTRYLVSHSNGGTDFSYSMEVNGGGINVVVQNTTPSTLFSSGYAISILQWHMVCGSYSTSDGIARSFMDGVPQTVSTALSPATLKTTTAPWQIGPTSAGNIQGFAGAFMTETQLSAARIAQLYSGCP